jgi:hypothetical protein
MYIVIRFGETDRKWYVDNPASAGEKKCRKKNFFDTAFASYFALLTDGNIRLTRSTNFLNQDGILTQVIGE